MLKIPGRIIDRVGLVDEREWVLVRGAGRDWTIGQVTREQGNSAFTSRWTYLDEGPAVAAFQLVYKIAKAVGEGNLNCLEDLSLQGSRLIVMQSVVGSNWMVGVVTPDSKELEPVGTHMHSSQARTEFNRLINPKIDDYIARAEALGLIVTITNYGRAIRAVSPDRCIAAVKSVLTEGFFLVEITSFKGEAPVAFPVNGPNAGVTDERSIANDFKEAVRYQ